MSTYWSFECLDHDPPPVSADEFTQHTDDYAFKQGVELATRRPLLTNEEIEAAGGDPYPDEHFVGNARRFLLQHPSCRLGLLNEYGERRPLPGTATAPASDAPPAIEQPVAGAGATVASTDCRTEEGIVVGLIDGVIAQARVVAKYLREHDLPEHGVAEALLDLRCDPDVACLIGDPVRVTWNEPGPPGPGWTPIRKLKRQQLETVAIALEDMRDRAIGQLQRAADTVAGLCDWTSDFKGARTVVEPDHRAWHFDNTCPYEAMAAVLRGEPDPRRLEASS